MILNRCVKRLLFQGPKKDPVSAREFIRDMFLEPIAETKTVYSHFTCATGNMKFGTNCLDHFGYLYMFMLLDTQNIQKIFDNVKDTILEKFLSECGLK